MTTVFTSAAGATIIPDALEGFESRSVSRSVVHDLLSGDVAITQWPARAEAGTLMLVFFGREQAFAARNLLSEVTIWQMSNVEIGQIGMSFVVTDDLLLTLSATGAAWLLEVPFQSIES